MFHACMASVQGLLPDGRWKYGLTLPVMLADDAGQTLRLAQMLKAMSVTLADPIEYVHCAVHKRLVATEGRHRGGRAGRWDREGT